MTAPHLQRRERCRAHLFLKFLGYSVAHARDTCWIDAMCRLLRTTNHKKKHSPENVASPVLAVPGAEFSGLEAQLPTIRFCRFPS